MSQMIVYNKNTVEVEVKGQDPYYSYRVSQLFNLTDLSISKKTWVN